MLVCQVSVPVFVYPIVYKGEIYISSQVQHR